MFFDKIKREIDEEVDLANKELEYEKKISDLQKAFSHLKMEYDNFEDALCQKKDEHFMEMLTKKMEENGLTRTDEDVRYDGSYTYFKYAERNLVITTFPKPGRVRKILFGLTPIGLDSKDRNSFETYGRDKLNITKSVEFEIHCFLNYDGIYRDEYSQDKNEEYYNVQIKKIKECKKIIEALDIETGIIIYITRKNTEMDSFNNAVYNKTSCFDAVESILAEIDKNNIQND